MLRKLIPIIAGILVLSGCATSKKVPEPEKMATPERWMKHPTYQATEANAPLPSDWWTALNDQQLNELVNTGLKANADIAIAVARLEQASGAAKGAHASRMPRLDAGIGAARERVPRSTFRYSDGTKETVSPHRQSRFNANVTASYEVDLLGRLKLGQQSAEAQMAANQSDVLAVKRWLVREIVLAYADIRITDDLICESKLSQAIQRNIVSAEEKKLLAGLSTRSTLRKVRREMTRLHDAEATLQRDRDLALAHLAALLGKAPVELQITPAISYFKQLKLSGAISPGLPASIIAERADVAAAWQRVVAASMEAKQVRLEQYPSLNLTGSTGFISETVKNWLKKGAHAWLAQALLQVPIFDGGRIEARTNQAIAAFHEQQATYRKTVLQAMAEVESALSESATAQERLHLSKKERNRFFCDLKDAHAALKVGRGSWPALLQSELALIEADSTVSLRHHELLVAWASTQKALGR